jgi:two-component system sensor histidine kinase CpxA
VRSIFAKVLLWSLGTFALSLVAYWAISRTMEHRGPPKGDPFPHFLEMVEDDLCRSYEKGGSDQLGAQLRRLDGYLPGEHLLTDDRGRDLATGRDRSDLLKKGGHFSHGPPRLPDGRMIFIAPPRDRRYRFISVVQPWFDHPSILPYYGAIVVVIALMGWILAAHLAAPLRRLRRLVDQFGHGDLAARSHSTRQDEIGELSRSFDEMAGRIETLLSAERRLLQDVSHELRSPLTRLDVAVDLASTSDDPAEFLVRIKRDIGRLAVLVNELLQLTRAEGDPSAQNFEDVRLDRLVAGLIEDCEVEAEAKGCKLERNVRLPLEVHGALELLRRAVENVVRNAIRHAPDATAVEVGLELRGDVATISVRDHGSGVPDNVLGAIFEPFYRVEGDRSRASGGLGLGLAIARRAVELHQGKITAQNACPGLLVKIELPRAVASPNSDVGKASLTVKPSLLMKSEVTSA